MNPFFVLGLNHECTDDEVKTRYNELVRLYPPDTHPEQFAMISKAFASLETLDLRVDAFLFYMPEDKFGRMQTSSLPDLPSEKRPRISFSDLQKSVLNQGYNK